LRYQKHLKKLAAYKKVKLKGVEPNGKIIPYPPEGRFFSVNDPDDNFLRILQSYRVLA